MAEMNTLVSALLHTGVPKSVLWFGECSVPRSGEIPLEVRDWLSPSLKGEFS